MISSLKRTRKMFPLFHIFILSKHGYYTTMLQILDLVLIKMVLVIVISLHPKKVMLCIWWDVKVAVYYELLHQTINSVNNLTVWSQLLHKNGLHYLIDDEHIFDMRSHTSVTTLQKLVGFSWKNLPHPAYKPDIVPSDYHLIRLVQMILTGIISHLWTT